MSVGRGRDLLVSPSRVQAMTFASAKFFSMWCRGGGSTSRFLGRITPPPMEHVFGITSTWMTWWRPMRSWVIVWSRVNSADITSGREKAPASKKPWRPLGKPPATPYRSFWAIDDLVMPIPSWPIRADCKRWVGPRGIRALLPCSPAR